MYYLAVIKDKTGRDTYCTLTKVFFLLLGSKIIHQMISIRASLPRGQS